MKRYINLLIIILITGAVSCTKPLDEKVFSELAPTNFFRNGEDAEVVLNAAYNLSQSYRDMVRDYITFGEMTTDILILRQGAIFTFTQPVEDFTWDASHVWLSSLWQRYYSAIYRTNTILDRVPDINMNDQRKTQILAEARFLRAMNYFYLYDLFGPTPLIVTSATTVGDRPVKATKAEFIKFVEDEFTAAAAVLPITQTQFPRATKGAALGFLCKFHLNNKKWSEAAAAAQQVMQTNAYAIFRGNNRTDLFALANEGNSEFIFSAPFVPATSAIGNSYLSHAAPAGYKYQFGPRVIFAANLKIRSAFINTFDPTDERLGAFLFSYVNQAGATIVLGTDDVRSFKYPEDPQGSGDFSGNDFPLLRYADILLSRAEALNEISGPTQEALDLINEVRDAARIPLLQLTDIADQADLRDRILAERGWEFHTEGLRRQDLIRHGKLIDWALERGKVGAKPFHVLFPIPQREVDANTELVQNEGY